MSKLVSFDEIKLKYPDCHHAPRDNCKFCGGSGEKTKHLSGGEFIKEQDLVVPCMCIFVEHDYVDELQSALNATIEALKGGKEWIPEKENFSKLRQKIKKSS